MIVLLSGYKGSGKDTVADYLETEHKFQKRSFASPLKEMVAKTYNVPIDWFHDRYLKETPLLQYPVQSKDDFSRHVNNYMAGEHFHALTQLYHTPRSLCILEGSIKRSVDANYWVNQVVATLDNPALCYVIADWRYQSEYNALHKVGLQPVTIRINRFDSTTSTDPSERDLDKFSFQHVIENKGTKEEMFMKIKTALFGQ